MSEDTLPYEAELIEQAMSTPITVESSKHDERLDYMKVVCKVNEEDVETSAFGLIYTMAYLSFRDARPAGVSEMHFEDGDAWRANDMLRFTRFQWGLLYFEADYERGRRMKTTIQVTREGELTLETSGRGSSAARWIATIQGKKVLALVASESKK